MEWDVCLSVNSYSNSVLCNSVRSCTFQLQMYAHVWHAQAVFTFIWSKYFFVLNENQISWVLATHIIVTNWWGVNSGSVISISAQHKCAVETWSFRLYSDVRDVLNPIFKLIYLSYMSDTEQNLCLPFIHVCAERIFGLICFEIQYQRLETLIFTHEYVHNVIKHTSSFTLPHCCLHF